MSGLTPLFLLSSEAQKKTKDPSAPSNAEGRFFSRTIGMASFPSYLRSRSGWAELLELKRTAEPHVHQIEPTNSCPYSCVMCPRPTRMERGVGFMDFALYQKIIDEISGFPEQVRGKEIELFHFGESLLHPRLHEMAGYASDRGLKITLSVNAPELSPRRLEKLLENRPFRIIVSFDGYDEASYRRIRGRAADYGKAVENISYVAGLLKSGRGLAGAGITLRIIRLNMNDGRIEGFRREWEDKGVPVEVREFFPWTEKELVTLGALRKYPPYMPCPFPWQYLAVQWDGTVVPCCRDYNGVNPMGNVRDASLREIWNGEPYSRFRGRHRSGEYGGNEFCKGCMEIFYTEG